MHPATPFVTNILATLTLSSDIILLGFFIWFLIFAATKRAKAFFHHPILKFFARNAFAFAFIVALTAMSGSLFYSDVAGFEPCILCWYQRILMYPLVLLFGMAIARKEVSIVPYSLAMSAIGALIAGYHYFIQRIPQSFTPCKAVGYSASCTETFTMSYGYITIPMMSLTAFLLIIGLLVTYRQGQLNKK